MLVIIALILNYKKQSFSFAASEILFACFLLFANLYGVCLGTINPEWVLSGISLLFFYTLVRRIPFNLAWIFGGIVSLGIIQAAYGIAQYLDCLENYINSFRINRCFDNPAGFAAALLVVFPFALFLVSKKQIYWRIVGGLTAVLFIVAVVL